VLFILSRACIAECLYVCCSVCVLQCMCVAVCVAVCSATTLRGLSHSCVLFILGCACTDGACMSVAVCVAVCLVVVISRLPNRVYGLRLYSRAPVYLLQVCGAVCSVAMIRMLSHSRVCFHTHTVQPVCSRAPVCCCE